MINIKESEREIISNIVSQYANNCEVLAFGSRVCGNNKETSDLDLAFVIPDNKKMPIKQWGNIKYAFGESDLPFIVDIVDYNSCEDYFKKIIDKNNLKIYSLKK